MVTRQSSDEQLRRPMQHFPSPAGPSPAPLSESVSVCLKGIKVESQPRVSENSGNKRGGEHVTEQKGEKTLIVRE